LLYRPTGAAVIAEPFLRRLEDDRTRGFLRAAAWAAVQDLGSDPIPSEIPDQISGLTELE
jgi:hypothetical protein